jgi:hypothetical protein
VAGGGEGGATMAGVEEGVQALPAPLVTLDLVAVAAPGPAALLCLSPMALAQLAVQALPMEL